MRHYLGALRCVHAHKILWGLKMALASLLVSKRDAAHALGVSLRTVDDLLSARELPSRRIGRRVLIPLRALEQFARRDHGTKKAPDAATDTVANARGAL